MPPPSSRPVAQPSPRLTVRPGAPADADALAALLAAYLAESYGGAGGMTPAQLRRDVLGPAPRQRVLLAEVASAGVGAGAEPVGFVAWDAMYELQWGVAGARVADLYVAPARRGHGVALALLAALAAEVARGGGTFLRGAAHPRDSTRRGYARAAVVRPTGEVYLANRAFRRVAALAGRPARAMLRALPPPAWNDEADTPGADGAPGSHD